MFSQLPFDLRTQFDNGLKAVPIYPLQVKGALLYVRARLEHIDLPKPLKWRYLAQKSALLKLEKAYPEAANILEDLIKTFQDLEQTPENQQRLTVHQIRLGNIYHLDKRFTASNQVFKTLLEAYSHWPEAIQNTYGHFLWQHAGKNAFDQKNYDEAQRFFEQALAYRQRMNLSQELIESSKLALSAISFA